MSIELQHRNFELDVIAWRRRQLTASGFASGVATAVAADAAYDVHRLIELVERGCPPALAVRILAPLDVA
jgi:hypothetical protein